MIINILSFRNGNINGSFQVNHSNDVGIKIANHHILLLLQLCLWHKKAEHNNKKTTYFHVIFKTIAKCFLKKYEYFTLINCTIVQKSPLFPVSYRLGVVGLWIEPDIFRVTEREFAYVHLLHNECMRMNKWANGRANKTFQRIDLHNEIEAIEMVGLLQTHTPDVKIIGDRRLIAALTTHKKSVGYFLLHLLQLFDVHLNTERK